mmetsp:Transcript_81244/g.217159  ORF Transcript_81244/g.217159 Transcript_81244/m.217159 type:complete len:686 (-) Transcript_81244:26-2083(-)
MGDPLLDTAISLEPVEDSPGNAARVPPEPPILERSREGEKLSSDPDWARRYCWLASYARMHRLLIQRAQGIQADVGTSRQTTAAAVGQETPSIKESLRLLRREVLSLSPLGTLYIGMCLSVVLTATNFSLPYFQGRLVDAAILAHHEHKEGEPVDIVHALGIYILVIGIATLVGYTCEVLVGIFFAVFGHTTITRLRIKLFRNLTVQEIAFYDAHVSGELSSRLINDAAALSSLTQFTTQYVLGAVVKFVGSLVAMYLTHWQLAVVATVITPVNTLLVRRTGRTVGHYGVVQNDAMAKANAVATEVLSSIRAVQSNGGEPFEAVRFMEKMNAYLRVIKFTVYSETVLRFTAYGLSKARDLVVLALAMYQVVSGTLSVGSYTAFAQYVSLYEDGFKQLADFWVNFQQTVASTGKFLQLLLREPVISSEGGQFPADCAGSVRFEQVSFEYPGRPDQPVLAGLDLRASPGDVIALVGESGAGKSTVGRLLQRYYDPTGGRILLDGRCFTELNLRWLRAQIGVVEQEPVLFDRTIAENIAYGSAEGRSLEEVRRAAELCNAHGFISALAQGYDARPGERAARISGGQKQRIAIARAIVREPRILLLDEATSALDSENEHLVQVALDQVMVGRTTFVIAHRLSTVVRATKILVMDKGVVVESGTHEELVADEKTRYSGFMRHQLVGPLLS